MTLFHLELIPLSQALAWEWEGNPKKHDIFGIKEALNCYGFQDPPKFDRNIPSIEGNGGIIGGNGRLLALKDMQEKGEPPPKGIDRDDDGEWLIPILFGNDLENETQALAFGLDANSLTLSGSGLSQSEMAALYEPELYTNLLTLLSEAEAMPVSVSEKDLSAFLEAADTEIGGSEWGYGEDDIEEANREVTADTIKAAEVQFTLGQHFNFKVSSEVYMEWRDVLRLEVGFNDQKIAQEILRRLGF